MGSLNTGAIGSTPSVTFVVSWSPGSSAFTVTATKNADGSFTGGGWTVYVGFEGGSSGSAYLSAPVGTTYTTPSTSVTVYVNPPSSGTLYFYTTSNNFTSSGVIPYAQRKQASYSSYLTVTVEDRVGNYQGQLLGSGSYSVQYGATVRASSLRSPPSYSGYTYSSDTSNTIYQNTTLYLFYNKATYSVYYYPNDTLGTVINMPTSPESIQTGGKISSTTPTKQYIVTLDANGGTSPSSSLTSSISMSSWNTNSSGTGTNYLPGATYSGSGNLSLYAKWSTTIPPVTLPTPTRQGYTFVGWAESTSATTGITGSYTPQKSIKLYAIWKNEDGIFIYNGGQYKGYTAWVYVTNRGWVRATPYVYLNGTWYMSTSG